jgi:hypothetical protein
MQTFAETPIALISLLENRLESNGYDNGSVGGMEKEWMDWQEWRLGCLHSRSRFSRRAESQRVDIGR